MGIHDCDLRVRAITPAGPRRWPRDWQQSMENRLFGLNVKPFFAGPPASFRLEITRPAAAGKPAGRELHKHSVRPESRTLEKIFLQRLDHCIGILRVFVDPGRARNLGPAEAGTFSARPEINPERESRHLPRSPEILYSYFTQRTRPWLNPLASHCPILPSPSGPPLLAASPRARATPLATAGAPSEIAGIHALCAGRGSDRWLGGPHGGGFSQRD